MEFKDLSPEQLEKAKACNPPPEDLIKLAAEES